MLILRDVACWFCGVMARAAEARADAPAAVWWVQAAERVGGW